MESFADRLEEIAFITRSATRARILDVLHRTGPKETRELRDRFDCDRTTLQRNLDALIEHGWIQETNGTYRITQAGELLAAGLSELVDATGAAMKLQPFLRWMPTDEFDLDTELLADADITVADRSHPHGAVSKHIDVLERATRFRGLFPSLSRHALDTIWRRVTNRDGTFEVTITEDCAEVLQSKPTYAEQLDEIVESDRADVLLSAGDIPYYLGIAEGAVQLGVEDTDGVRRALLETERSAVRSWAEDTYETYRRQATPLNHGSYKSPGLTS